MEKCYCPHNSSDVPLRIRGLKIECGVLSNTHTKTDLSKSMKSLTMPSEPNCLTRTFKCRTLDSVVNMLFCKVKVILVYFD